MNQVAKKDEASNAKIIYILYLASIVVGVTGIIGLIMAYIHKADAPEWVQQHYQYQIRTFWIGLLYGLIGAILTMVLIGFLVLIFCFIWYIVRCVKGMQALDAGQPPANVMGWMF